MGEPDSKKGPEKYPPDMFFEQVFPDVIFQIMHQRSLIPVIYQRMALQFMANLKSVDYGVGQEGEQNTTAEQDQLDDNGCSRKFGQHNQRSFSGS